MVFVSHWANTIQSIIKDSLELLTRLTIRWQYILRANCSLDRTSDKL